VDRGKYLSSAISKPVYHIKEKSATVQYVFSTISLIVSFRSSLVGVNLQSWHDLVLSTATVHLNDQPEIFRCARTSSGHFSVSSMYQAMIDLDIVPHNIFLWKLKYY
jgi:hypothetical protein